MVNPIPELNLPQIEVFPDQSDLLEGWLIQESRGTPEGQQKDVQFIIDEVYKEKIKCNLPVRLVGGGRPDISFEIGKEIDHHNVVDTLKDGRIPDARERRNFENLVRLSQFARRKGFLSTFG